MRRFLLVLLAVYVVIFVSNLACTVSNDGDMLKALPDVVLGAPWFQIIGSLEGDKMSYPEKINEEIDDDCFSRIGCGVLAASGLINAAIIYGASRFFRNPN